MQPTYRLDTQVNHPRTRTKVQALIADLRWRIQLLDSDIHEEEKLRGIFDVCNVAYSMLALDLRARRDNLLATISMLEKQSVKTNIAA
jgi:hypothetical protein